MILPDPPILGIDFIFLVKNYLVNEYECNVLCLINDKSSFSFDFYIDQLHRRSNSKVNFMLIKSGEAMKYLQVGHLFYTNVCNSENLIFPINIDYYPLPQINFTTNKVRENARITFNKYNSQVQTYLNGAIFFIERGQPNLAAFMLHQTAEQSLRAFLIGLQGHFIRRFSIRHYVRYTLFISEEIANAIPPSLMYILNKSHIGNIHHSQFDVDNYSLLILKKCIRKLIGIIEIEFYKKVTI
jgi:hypothetical protein